MKTFILAILDLMSVAATETGDISDDDNTVRDDPSGLEKYLIDLEADNRDYAFNTIRNPGAAEAFIAEIEQK